MIRLSLFWIKTAWSILWRKSQFVPQSSASDNEMAVALTVLQHFRVISNQEVLQDRIHQRSSGTRSQALAGILDEFSRIRAEPCDLDRKDALRAKGLILMRLDQSHFVVRVNSCKSLMHCFDPSVGHLILDRQNFLARYSGEAIRCSSKRTAGNFAKPARPKSRLPLVLIGAAARILQFGLIAVLAFLLFLIQAGASFETKAFAVGFGCIIAILYFLSSEAEVASVKRQATEVQRMRWFRVLRGLAKKHDLLGFRGRPEKSVASHVKRSISVNANNSSHSAAIVGRIGATTLALWCLSDMLALVYALMIFVGGMLVALSECYVAQNSLPSGALSFQRLSHKYPMVHPEVVKTTFGEVSRLLVIAFAGFAAVQSDMSTAALLFWVVSALQIVPLDFRNATEMVKFEADHDASFDSISKTVPVRIVDAPIAIPELTANHKAPDLLVVKGLEPLMRPLNNADLTSLEQRNICLNAAQHSVDTVVDLNAVRNSEIRLFGFGNDASLADLGYIRANEASSTGTAVTATISEQEQVTLRSLQSCESRDFPVFWNIHGSIDADHVRRCLTATDLRGAGILTMNELVIVHREAS